MKTTSKEKLLEWLKYQKENGINIIRTSDIISWGSIHYSNSAERNARHLREEGYLERISRNELLAMGIKTREQAYRVL